MKRWYRFFLSLGFLFLIASEQAQSEKRLIKEANKALEKGHRDAALHYFHKALEINPENAKVNLKVGILYLESIYKTKSLTYLEKAFAKNPKISNNIYWLLGEALHYNHRMEEAIEHYEKQKEFVESDDPILESLEREIKECETGKELMANPIDVKIENLGSIVNSPFPEYAPVISADESVLIFTSRREGSTGGELDEEGGYFEDIYISERVNNVWTTPRNIGTTINTPSHDGSVGLSPDGKELFIYKDDGNGDIYYCKLKKDGSWSKPLPIEGFINSKKSYENAASISADYKRLFFASSREGSFGGLDIYMSEMNEEGNWGKPVNLGATVNTAGDEEGPFLDLDGKTLYFSSTGHKSMGDFDLFKTVYDAHTNEWSDPQNMGYPLNTADDDIYFVLSGDGKHGYYASVKEDGLGEKDLYRITMPPRDDIELLQAKLKELTGETQEIYEHKEPEIKTTEVKNENKDIILKPVLLKGTITETNSGKPLSSAIVQLQDPESAIVSEVATDEKGGYVIVVKQEKPVNWTISAQYTGYGFASKQIVIPAMKEDIVEVTYNLNLKKLEVGSTFVLRNIYFDFNKATIKPRSDAELQKLEKLLRENPAMKIEIAGHTDSKGSEAYNKLLSQKRAQAVVDHLVTKGINKSRLSAVGYGEERPLASNDDEMEGRELNRRTEFEIVSK